MQFVSFTKRIEKKETLFGIFSLGLTKSYYFLAFCTKSDFFTFIFTKNDLFLLKYDKKVSFFDIWSKN